MIAFPGQEGASSPEEQAAVQKLHNVLKEKFGDVAPASVSIASHSPSHVTLNLHYTPGTYSDGERALNAPLTALAYSLGARQTSFLPQGEELLFVQVFMNISLDKLLWGIDKMEGPGRKR